MTNRLNFKLYVNVMEKISIQDGAYETEKEKKLFEWWTDRFSQRKLIKKNKKNDFVF